MLSKFKRFQLAILLLGAMAVQSYAYSVLTHEQLIDLSWNTSIRPLLMARFPGTSEQALDRAHAFAYGGCVIQDLGYYPFGNEFFSDLTHYVRSGDFIGSLLRNARTADEYAFALGALSHYLGDNIGHRYAINLATAIGFPKLAKKFGPVVTYGENHHAHVRTEFAFDVEQLSKHRLAPASYLRHIGLQVSHLLLERAFLETYGLPLNEMLGMGRRPSFKTYRWSVRSFLPRISYAETVLHRDEFLEDTEGEPLKVYLQRLEKADFQKVWSQYRGKPGFRTYTIALLIRILPKIGPLSNAAICIPDKRTEDLYIRSVNRTAEAFDRILSQLRKQDLEAALLPNRDLDTGEMTRRGKYALTDETYAKLLKNLSKRPENGIPESLREDILGYYAEPNDSDGSKNDWKPDKQLEAELSKLRQMKKLSLASLAQISP